MFCLEIRNFSAGKSALSGALYKCHRVRKYTDVLGLKPLDYLSDALPAKVTSWTVTLSLAKLDSSLICWEWSRDK